MRNVEFGMWNYASRCAVFDCSEQRKRFVLRLRNYELHITNYELNIAPSSWGMCNRFNA